MKRTFIALKIEPEEKLKHEISFITQELKNEKIKWAELNNLHVTLAFLGDTDERLITRIGSMLEKQLAGSGIISFSLSGFGIFRNISDPRILFTSIENHKNLVDIHSLIIKGLADLDVKLEERSFRPHLTIGRIKEIRDRDKLIDLINCSSGKKFQDVIISEVIYYESILRPEGALYKPLYTILVKG